MSYIPPKQILHAYADLLVNFALGGGKGVRAGEVVEVLVPDVAKPMLLALHEHILRAGAHPVVRLIPTGTKATFYSLANQEQLTFFPADYIQEKIKLFDHSIAILAEHDLHELSEIDPQKIMLAAESTKQARIWRNAKEYAGEFSWTLALYGTPAMAAEAGMSIEDYWQQIIDACYLTDEHPVDTWQGIQKELMRITNTLQNLQIKKVHIEAENTDLWLNIGQHRRWIGGGGRNIPSFEVFTSPDWRGTQGHISFNQPLYRYGKLIQDISLEFVDGVITKATASANQDLLLHMISRPNANKVGEFSLTDSRLSKITKFMANTLFDENVGGPQGNTHIAVGMAYKDCYDGNPKDISESQWEEMGFNDSGEHCDIISTTQRTVTAILESGEERILYTNGQFQI